MKPMTCWNLAGYPQRLHDMKRIALPLTLLAVIATACGGATSTDTTPQATEWLQELEAAEQLWESASPADYTVTQLDRSEDESVASRTLAVRDGEVVSLAGDTTTVEEVFDAIEESIRRGGDVEVEYHSDLGYPVRVVVDEDRDGVSELDLEHLNVAAMPVVRSVEELRWAQRRWEAQQLDSYRYIFRFDCTCPESGTFQVDVQDGRVVETVPLDEAARASSLHPGLEIDAAFGDLEEWFTNSGELIDEGILAVDVRMDPRYGYPRWFRIEGQDIDNEFFSGRFTMVVTIDLIAELEPVHTTVDSQDLGQIDAAMAAWQQAGLTDFRYVLTIHCMCPGEVAGPFEVTIRNGELDSVIWQGDGEATDAHVFLVDEALEMIGSAVVDGVDVDVVYDPDLGYPQQAIIDTEAVAVDGGLAFSITDLEPLE
ncbi:MAG: DUF6174 domain-containing protein [Acidimicrobiia bacterium]|nr:DUF6174 domain-containing protein [Acidimicrobiia bacterium]